MTSQHKAAVWIVLFVGLFIYSIIELLSKHDIVMACIDAGKTYQNNECVGGNND